MDRESYTAAECSFLIILLLKYVNFKVGERTIGLKVKDKRDVFHGSA